MLKWLAIAIMILGGLVALVAIVGVLLPRDHVAARSASYHQPPETVFAAISDVAGGAAWRKSLSSVEMLPRADGRVRFREISGHDRITMEIQELRPPSRMVTRIADPDQPFGGTWTFELVPEGPRTRLTITERGEIYNPIFRALARFVFGYSSTIEGYLTDLGQKFGETAVVDKPQ